jgi:Ca2+-binding EF-hand superfamily protein
VFKALDHDNSGSLTIAEFKQALKESVAKGIRVGEGVLESVDLDHSGSISYTEFL